MVNEIVVTRAPRLKLTDERAVPKGGFYLDMSNGCLYQVMNGQMKHEQIGDPPTEWKAGKFREYAAYHFESFRAMCKWVSNGRKLEDLQGDASSEWIRIKDMKTGEFAVVVSDPDDAAFIGIAIHKRDSFGNIPPTWTRLDTSVQYPAGELVTRSNDHIMVWPLNAELGDSITITAQP